MLAIISPAKTQDFSDHNFTSQYSMPGMLDQSKKLVDLLRKKNKKKIMELMDISEDLASLNVERYQQFELPFAPDNAKQAILAFKGDVYTGVDIDNYTAEDLDHAQEHLRILSGLYGLLRPLDLIQPYRLEMKIQLKNRRGKDLYAFWGDRITQQINEALAAQGDKVLINLASNEYFKAVNKKKLNAEMITPDFKDMKNGQYKIISFFAKKARGRMASYILQNRLSQPEELKNFDLDGYAYNAAMSKGNNWVFTRNEEQ